MDLLLNILAGLGALLALIVLRSLRRDHIRVEHSVSWLAAAAAIILLSRSRTLLERLSALLDLKEPAMALLLLILIVFLGVFYRFSRVISELKDMNITLTQRVAILEYKLQRQNEEQQAKS